MNKEPILIGALAGVTPLLVNLVNIQAETLLSQCQLNVVIGYAVQALVLMTLGAFLVYVNSEDNKWKAFQIGVMAPALVIGVLNGQKLDNTVKELKASQKQILELKQPKVTDALNVPLARPSYTLTFSLVTDAYAGMRGLHRQQSESDNIWSQLTGSTSNNWFVIAGSHLNERDAQIHAKDLIKKGYEAVVYFPLGDNKYFSVIIGSYLSLDEATRLKAQAIGDGLPRDMYLWKYVR
ncbi:MAG: hypothetical protein A2079_01740 [Geobacteraceae bacterium GWC2_48_7]|nr:MAG: hypothetical protein A2079_01740 [Geobacteraceae bacterium GWC2_48_7]